MDELTVQVEVAPDRADHREAAAAELSRRIKDRIGITVSVEILHPHALERSLGKAKRISDRR
jgi:phenylacetate-CoA ligase